jgi:hypothetical protein
MAEHATRVVVSYPADLSTWGRDIVQDRPFRAYLRKAHDTVTAGDRWTEFVGVGCCGSALDVPLRVERVDGGSELSSETAFEFTVREACDLDGGWRVQSADGPRAEPQ